MLQTSAAKLGGMLLSRGRSMRPMRAPHPFSMYRDTNEKEAVMKITSLVITLTVATALVALAQEGTVEDVKQGAKKAGQTVKNGLETAGKKTKEAAETVGEKTKETAKTVGKKTKETAETVGEKTKETAKTVHRKSKRAVKKAKAATSSQESTNQAPNTPSPSDR
jgi:hypothetical protein